MPLSEFSSLSLSPFCQIKKSSCSIFSDSSENSLQLSWQCPGFSSDPSQQSYWILPQTPSFTNDEWMDLPWHENCWSLQADVKYSSDPSGQSQKLSFLNDEGRVRELSEHSKWEQDLDKENIRIVKSIIEFFINFE